MIVHSMEEVVTHERFAVDAAERTAEAIRAIPGSGIDLLRRMKFEECGRHPGEERSLNLIEQVNQTFTYFATFRAMRHLFANHPEVAAFRLNIGTTSGSDIEDVDRQVVAAEVFAAVSPQNNRKLSKDLAKVSAACVPHRYVFFACPGYVPGRHAQMETSGVQVWALEL